MAADIANYISRTFRAPNPAEVDRTRYSNALMRNQVDRLPQQNRAQDLAIQASELDLGNVQRQNAAGVLGRNFSIIANSPRPREAARAFLGSPDFQAAGRLARLPVELFTITDADTDDVIRQQATAWADALSGRSQPSRVQSAQVLEDGTIAYLTSDGQLVRTNEKARNPLDLVEYGGGKYLLDKNTGKTSPLSTPQQEIDVAAEKAGAEAWAKAAATAGVDLQKEALTKQSTLGVWTVAREGLLRALAGTNTGPVSGLMPAITANQQIAQGAVAAVAPVLKQLFRSAGEGVFTDRDQQLLLDMVPQRTDHPETVAAKMQMIDDIIRAKLSSQTTQITPPGAPTARTDFATEEEAAQAAAQGLIKPGQRITVGGVSGVWQ